MKQFIIILLSVLATVANAQRETILLNAGWRFALGNAASMQKDFGHGTEYFTYLSKAASANQNTGPAFEKFNDDGAIRSILSVGTGDISLFRKLMRGAISVCDSTGYSATHRCSATDFFSAQSRRVMSRRPMKLGLI